MIMQCEEMEALMIDYLDGQLSPAARTNVEKHLETCMVCRQALEEYKALFHAMGDDKMEKPGPALREKFDIMLQSELNIDATSRILKEEKEGKVIAMKKPSLFLRIAASIILVAGGVLIGTKITPGTLVQGTGSAEIASLKSEVREIKETLMFSGLNDESATERIKAVNYVEEMKNPDQKVMNALLVTINNDRNVNVRLAALYSVAKFAGSQLVRDSLVASLPRQTEPIMQIVLINILTEQKETKAIGPIRDLLSDKKIMKPVKDIAQKGLRLL
ncbi:MAG: anti-sigma factor [Chitinophagaceae bacterium]|nr:anti-sigma factor [Chitinophagaceae bacterium]